MTDIISLLTLPQTSKGFTALRSTVVDNGTDHRSESPPRKTPRLSADSDSTSSRSRKQKNNEKRGPITIHIDGEPVKRAPDSINDPLFAQVRGCIRMLLQKDGTDVLPATYEGIYSACRSIVCISNRGEGLYENLKIEIEQCAVRLARSLSDDKATGVEWIKVFNDACGWFERQVALLQSLLTYLDRVYILAHKDLPNIHTLSYTAFTIRVFQTDTIVARLRSGVEEWLQWERRLRLPSDERSCITALIAHLLTHGHYTTIFEKHYLSLTDTFYTAESLTLSESHAGRAQDFLKQVDLRLGEEEERAREVLPPFSLTAVKSSAERALLSDRLKWLGDRAVAPLMESKDIVWLGRMYKLFARVDGLAVLCTAFKTYVQTKVQGIVKDKVNDERMVDRLLEFKKLVDTVVSDAFSDDVVEVKGAQTANQDFSYAVTDAFTLGFKSRPRIPAEMIAKYLDRAMRKGQRDMSDTDFETLLDSALRLYRFTDDKDVFRAFYMRGLAKRLLLERSASDDAEKAMLQRLKEQYDPDFGMGDNMFKDLALSRGYMEKYRDADPQTTGKLNVMVLQRSFWPLVAQKSDVDLPPSMQDDLNRFTAWYKTIHKGHKLEWDHSRATATLKARFAHGQKELSVSLHQAVVLLLFKSNEEMSFKEILDSTRMDDKELRRTLQSLACANKKVLKKKPAGRDVDDTDVFYFNAEFTDPRAKVHINSIQAKDTAEETKRTQTSVDGDRKHYLDAAIVRIMKARKEMKHEQLKVATIDAVKGHFVPDVASIKNRIQSLVEQEYLKRDEKDKELYMYVA
ncbi:hypothetical protein PLICRDRAFT_55976 [Plicaturopsis crispa FD-325 SS-3]|nr:hypothetical protein PLICRDRAFT_55976 [Plicaturopsis crispa FD-325 SS-3]